MKKTKSLFANYKQQKNEITKLIRQSKKTYYNEYFSKNNTNIKKTMDWSQSNSQ